MERQTCTLFGLVHFALKLLNKKPDSLLVHMATSGFRPFGMSNIEHPYVGSLCSDVGLPLAIGVEGDALWRAESL
jgi:hypothetical protein